MKNEIKEHLEKLLPVVSLKYHLLKDVYEEIQEKSKQKDTSKEIDPLIKRFFALNVDLLNWFEVVDAFEISAKNAIISSYYLMLSVYASDPSLISKEDLQQFKAKENEVIRLQKEVEALEEIRRNYTK